MAAQAADLGGNCCADLEERVAELEATTARKGNRKVSLTVSGHVNEALLWVDDGLNSGARIVTNGFSMTRFRFLGSAKINADWSAGFLMEFGLGRTGMSYDVNQATGAAYGGYSPVGIRHQALWVKSNTLGTLWMGHTTDAVDGLIDICLGCPITSSSEAHLGWGQYVPTHLGHYVDVTLDDLGVGQEGYYATRRNLLKYVSPTFAGFSFTASWGDNDDGSDASYTDGDAHDYTWNLALRYAGEFNSIRVAAGAGYTKDEGADVDSWAVVASMAHVPTGLYVAANYRTQQLDVAAGLDDTDEAWGVQVGIAQKWSSMGKTTFWVQYGEWDNGDRGASTHFNGFVNGVDATIWSGGINQKIDAAAMELYLTYWNIQTDVYSVGDTWALEDVNVVMAGARIQF
jgi:predicted porin